ncbi:MAG: SIMPL domain-containing protein [Candidatus Falkowbacteria bacterium]|nr:SIMPL domain-containing protein [Candidatus Falkowbacteria bacterium]
MKKTYVFLTTLGVLAVTAIVIVALVMADNVNNQDRFSVTGSGTVYAKANIANLEVGLKTGTKKTAAQATTDSTGKMNAIIEAVKALGIEEKDIKTSGYSLNPVYNWTNDKGQELIGYEVSQDVALKIRDLNKIGDVIAKTTEKGANQIGNISFTIDDEYELKNQARELAIEKAKEKAIMIAEQSGMKLGEVKSVYENAEPYISPIAYSNAKLDMGAGVSAELSAPSIQSGQNEIKVEATLVYEVK